MGMQGLELQKVIRVDRYEFVSNSLRYTVQSSTKEGR